MSSNSMPYSVSLGFDSSRIISSMRARPIWMGGRPALSAVSAEGGVGRGLAVFRRADHLDEVVRGNGVACFAAEDVIHAGDGAARVAQADEVGFGIGNAPASVGIDGDVELVLGGHLGGDAIPFEHALFDAVHGLDER
jgi:hypothetical protein